MKYRDIFENVNFSADGIGGVPNNHEVNYFGTSVKMTPKTFLSLAAPLSRDQARSAEYFKQAMERGESIGQPFISFDVPEGWSISDFSQPIQVDGHEGRNRALAIAELYGDDYPMEVHLFFRGYRARHLTPDWLTNINRQMKNEKGYLLRGPFFQ